MKRKSNEGEQLMQISSNIDKKTKKLNTSHCDYCRRDISCQTFIECAICSDFKVCLECFCSGVELLNHKNNHSYKIIEFITESILEEGWGANEELALLDAINIYGFGNWTKIAEHIGTKSKARCEAHYNNVYLLSKNSPLPENVIKKPNIFFENSEYTSLVDKGITDSAKWKEKDTYLKGLGNSVGYQPYRNDFDCEYENDAEQIIATLEFSAYDSEQERLLKRKVLEIYNNKLIEREKRKRFILERDLLLGSNSTNPSNKTSKKTKEEKETISTVKAFARFHSASEHEEFIKGLVREQQLRKYIQKLQQYRLLGIKTFKDAELYEIEAKKRENYDLHHNHINIPNPNIKQETNTSTTISQTLPTNNTNNFPADNIPTNNSLVGMNILSVPEQKLCSELNLLPKQYLQAKDAIVKYCEVNNIFKNDGSNAKKKFKELIRIDINKKSDLLIDYFIGHGWINRDHYEKKQDSNNK